MPAYIERALLAYVAEARKDALSARNAVLDSGRRKNAR
jgi:hypothetical protein